MSESEIVPQVRVDTMPTGERCPIGPLNAHTYNYERDECIWCGPNGLGWKPGRWVDIGDGLSAWSVTSPTQSGSRLVTTYTCWSCTRTVDPDDEPSPGEPNTCPDCTHQTDREEQVAS